MSNNPSVSWYLECFPSEIPLVYEHLNGKPSPAMPAWVPGITEHVPRPVEQVLLFATVDAGLPAEAWDAYFTAESVRHVTRIQRREAMGATSIGISKGRTWACAIETQESGAWRLTFLPGTEALARWLAGVTSILEVPALQVSSFRKAPPAMLALIGAFCDLFNERFPHPDPYWAPAGNPEFTIEALEEYFLHPERSGWYARLLAIFPDLPTDPGVEQLEILLQVLRNEKLVGEAEGAEGTWYMATGLLWAIRMMAWWDLGISIPDHTAGSTLIIQASCPWVLTQHAKTWTLEAVHGPEIVTRLMDWLETAGSSMVKPPPIPVRRKLVPPPPPSSLACPACHQPVQPTARFCPHCGNKLKS